MSLTRKRVIPQSLGENYNFEHVTSSKSRGFIRHRVLENHITSNSYEDSLILDVRLFERKLFHIKNKGANNILFKILACIDPSFWETIKDETTLNAGTSTYEWLSAPWAFVKIQVKSATADTPSIVDAYIAAQN